MSLSSTQLSVTYGPADRAFVQAEEYIDDENP
jgi:hypothetical protein